MNELKLNEIQTYFNEETNEHLELCFDYYETIIGGIIVKLDGVPLLKNEKNNTIFFPQKTKYLIENFIEEAKEKGEKGIYLKPNQKREVRYSFAEKFNFIYSYIDYEYIFGLMTEYSNEGFLVPVFFNLKVLNKYSQDPDYQLEIFSSTYGSICKGKEWNIQFGVNKNNKVIMWLGDIHNLPENEKYYLKSENIESDHTIHSEFYNAQIEVQWAELSVENKAFEAKNQLNKITKEKYSFDFYSFHGEISSILKDLNLPIFWTEKHISPFIDSLNRIFVESLNSQQIKIHLKALNPTLTKKELSGLKALKLFQKWIELHSDVDTAKSLMLPFFVLYDFRVFATHLLKNARKKEIINSICERLELEYKGNNYEEVYRKLISHILNSYMKIINLVEKYSD